PRDRAGGEQQRLGERRLACAAVPDERDVADLGRREHLHARDPQGFGPRSIAETSRQETMTGESKNPLTSLPRPRSRAGRTRRRWYPAQRSTGGREQRSNRDFEPSSSNRSSKSSKRDDVPPSRAGVGMLDGRWRAGVERGLRP